MSIKLKLFASVAAPVLSLPLLMQPVYAIPPGFGNDPSLAAPGIIRVQQEVIPEAGQQAEQPAPKEQQAEQPAEEPPRREQKAEQPQQAEPPQEQPAAEQPKPRQQQAEQPAEQPAAEQPKRRQQQAEQPAEQPQEQPRQREQQNAEQPAAEQPKRREQRAQEEGGEKPRKREQQAEQPTPAEEPVQKKADQAPEPKEPETKPAEPKQAEPKQAEPTQRQAEEPKPSPERQQNAEQPAATETPQRSAEQPQGERPRQREQQAGEGQGGERPRRVQQAQDGQPATGTAAPDQATSGGERQPQPAAQQQAEQPATLPVENGAAVLDSAKEQRPGRPPRDGERPRRDPSQAGGQPAPGQQPAAQQAQEPAAPPPRTDADAQANEQNTREQREQWRNQRQELVDERGERMDRRPDFEQPRGWDVRGAGAGDREPGRDRNRDRDGGRVIISIDDRTIVRHDDSRRFYEDGRQPEYERLGGDRYREVVERGDGTRVVTIRNRYGEVVQRSRIVRGGEEYVLYYAPELLEDRENYTWRDPGDDLPPMRLGVPIDDYIIDTSSEPDRDYYEFLEQPPVERVERPYSLDEVRYSARIRDKVPRIDLDTITFATGSAEIPMNQASSLRKVADAINKVLKKDPAETFLIEGHTDAVGSDDSNLVLSDRRAESVAVVLSDAFGIPPENLTTQGYGEQYLKVNTEAANQENRRVTIRRITPLVKPVASKQ